MPLPILQPELVARLAAEVHFSSVVSRIAEWNQEVNGSGREVLPESPKNFLPAALDTPILRAREFRLG
jgi:hypothetical protein